MCLFFHGKFFPINFDVMEGMPLKKIVSYVFFLPLFFLLVSCSKGDYVNVIPENSIAVASIDAQSLFGGDYGSRLGKILKVEKGQDCGVDISEKLYMFETVDGNVGIAAKVSDKDKLVDWLDYLAKNNYCTAIIKQDKYWFTIFKNSWVIGFSSDALVALGPVLPAAQAEVKRTIIGYLGQDSDNGIKSSPIFEWLDSMKAPVAIVAQAAALPDKFVAPFTIGAPKDADASQVMLAAELNKDVNGCFVIMGEVFSFDKKIDDELKKSQQIYRPVTEKYLEKMPSDVALGVFINVDGSRFINLLHSNKAFQAILAGINTAIDMDNIIKSIDGDVAIMSRGVQSGVAGLGMLAQLKGKSFLDDVDYWKQSCPPGSTISDIGKNAYCYKNGDLSYPFGVTDDMQFYLGTLEKTGNQQQGGEMASCLSRDAVSKIKGHKLAIVLNVKALSGDNDGVAQFVESLLGDVKTILYIMK